MTLRRLILFFMVLAFPFALMSCSDNSTGAIDDNGGDDPDPDPDPIEFPITFEENVPWDDFITNFGGGELSVIENPDQSGINTSDNVARMVKGEGEVFGGSVVLLPESIDFTNGTAFTVSVWAPRADTKMLYKIENAEEPTQAFEREITIAESQEWVDITFDLSGADDSFTYEKLVFIFDLGTEGDGSADFTWYFDNIRQVEGDGGGGDPPAEPVDPAPTPTEDEANVISLFSDAYTDVNVTTWITEWSAAVLEDIDIQGNATKKYTGLNFVGIETTGDNLVDASSMTHFHIDVWTPNMDVIRVKLVDFGADGAFEGGDDSEHEIVFDNLPQEQWNTLKIPMSDFTGLQNQANIAQYILSGTPAGEGILYVDNFFFSNDGNGGGGGGGDIVELPLTFEQDIAWADAITNFEGGEITVIDNPDQTGNTSAKVAQMVKNAGATFAGSIITLTDNIDFADGTDFTVSVWAPRPNTTMLFKIENETNGGIAFEQELTIAESQEWVDITFDMSGANQANTYKKLVFIFDNGTAGDGSANYTWYFDNLTQSIGDGGGGGNTAEPAEPAPAPPSRNAEDVISIFSDAYTNIDVTTFATEWSEGSAVGDVEIATGDFIKLYNIGNFIGIQLDSGIDLTEFTHMHFDFWVADESIDAGAVFNPKLSNHAGLPDTEGETSAIVSTNPVSTAGEWVSFDVPLDDFTDAFGGGVLDRDKIYQIVMATSGTINMVYIDNLYFYK